jgi:lipopolysaccharide transport system ATP-binding protein
VKAGVSAPIEHTIVARGLGKCYRIYATPSDRLKQSIVPKFERLAAPVSALLGKARAPRSFFQEFWALRDVSFSLPRGETLGVVGRNGSGKSTLLQLVCGTLMPTTGEVRMNGRVAALLELGSGFNPEFTGRENVCLNAGLLGLTREELDQRFEAITAFADIGDFLDQPVKTYSSGMMMRLAFAVIAHVDADVLVIDEALAVGDAYFQQKCMRWLRGFRERGTVLFCSHDTGAVINLCRSAIWLDAGAVKGFGPAKDICEDYLASMHTQATGLAESTVRRTRKRDSDSAPPGETAPLAQSIRVFEFSEDSAGFGSQDAAILDVTMTKPDGTDLGLVQGGEEVQVAIRVRANRDIDRPIVGFHIKDRLGQALIGTNTYLKYRDRPLSVAAGQEFVGRFVFELPYLLTGNYAVTAAIASGTLDSHVQHHWAHDALVFVVNSPFRTGVLFGIPMSRITLEGATEGASADPDALERAAR